MNMMQNALRCKISSKRNNEMSINEIDISLRFDEFLKYLFFIFILLSRVKISSKRNNKKF